MVACRRIDMYSVKVELSPEKGAPPGATQDTEVVPFGIRTISFTADGGFQLNGKQVLLQGGCVHHDNGRKSRINPPVAFDDRALL